MSYRALTFQTLETRDLLYSGLAAPLGASLAPSLSDVVATPTGIAIEQSGPVAAAGEALVVQGTPGNDVIRIQRDTSIAGAVDVIFNGQETVWNGPVAAIVADGGGGNDSITVDGSLTIPSFLFSGAGTSTLTGGGGNNVIVAGGNDVLNSGLGRDILVGGSGAAQLFGSLTGQTVLIAGAFSGQYNLPTLEAMSAAWSGSGTNAARASAVESILGGTVQAGTVQAAAIASQIFEGNPADLVIAPAGNTDTVFTPTSDQNGVWTSSAFVDANGFTCYYMLSPNESGITEIRELLPANFSMSPKAPYRVIYVLPVEAGLGADFGDGMVTVKSMGLQNSDNTIFVGPTFSAAPWFVNSDTNSQIAQESYFCDNVVPFIKSTLPVVTQPQGQLLLGFSKSGFGAFTMLLRHPDLFGGAFAWDAPLAMSSPEYDLPTVLGTAQNLQNYYVPSLLQADASLLQNGPVRLFIMGYSLFQADLNSTNALMNELDIPHVYIPGSYEDHDWSSTWVSVGVNELLSVNLSSPLPAKQATAAPVSNATVAQAAIIVKPTLPEVSAMASILTSSGIGSTSKLNAQPATTPTVAKTVAPIAPAKPTVTPSQPPAISNLAEAVILASAPAKPTEVATLEERSILPEWETRILVVI